MSALGRGPSPLANAAIHVAYRANVDYLRNTGHSIDPTPPAGMAEQRQVECRIERLFHTPERSLILTTLGPVEV